MDRMLEKENIKLIKTLLLAFILMIGALGCEVIENRSWLSDWKDIGTVNLPPFAYTRSDELNKQSIEKVLVVPFAYNKGPEKIPAMVTDYFVVELNRTGMFQVINPSTKPSELLEGSKTLWDRGVIDVDLLLYAKKKYGVDGVLFGKITNYSPYVPLVLGLKVTMISTLSGSILWGIDGEFSSDQKETTRLAKNYYKKYYSRNKSLYGWEVMLISMDRYAQFVANMLVSTIVNND